MEALNRERNTFLGAAEQLFKVGGIRPHELSQNLFFVEDFPVETAFDDAQDHLLRAACSKLDGLEDLC